jgi:hypothetical protein
LGGPEQDEGRWVMTPKPWNWPKSEAGLTSDQARLEGIGRFSLPLRAPSLLLLGVRKVSAIWKVAVGTFKEMGISP